MSPLCHHKLFTCNSFCLSVFHLQRAADAAYISALEAFVESVDLSVLLGASDSESPDALLAKLCCAALEKHTQQQQQQQEHPQQQQDPQQQQQQQKLQQQQKGRGDAAVPLRAAGGRPLAVSASVGTGKGGALHESGPPLKGPPCRLEAGGGPQQGTRTSSSGAPLPWGTLPRQGPPPAALR
ncbi:hypothetical protein Efla_000699 [Eimeria flavescens]